MIIVGDSFTELSKLPDNSVQCCITSPPYWNLRDYGTKAQFGLEKTPEIYVGRLRMIFKHVHRILKPDGTLWLNIGDSYARNGGSSAGGNRTAMRMAHFATFPPDLIEPCILAGTNEGDTVLDPFFGVGTTGLVATKYGRKYIGIEINPKYAKAAESRIHGT